MKNFLLPLMLVVSACGTDHIDRRNRAPRDQQTIDQGLSAVVRGRWEVKFGVGPNMNNSSAKFLLSGAASKHEMKASVAENVKFKVDDANFNEPADPTEGDVSFGSLDISELRDNNLKVCGSSGTEKCTAAFLRVYSTGTPGSGLWNAVDGYGLPIKSSGNLVGLDAAAAHVVQSLKLGTQRVLKLSDFTSSSSLKIPYTVNFDDAGVGDFSTTMVVEYLVQ